MAKCNQPSWSDIGQYRRRSRHQLPGAEFEQFAGHRSAEFLGIARGRRPHSARHDVRSVERGGAASDRQFLEDAARPRRSTRRLRRAPRPAPCSRPRVPRARARSAITAARVAASSSSASNATISASSERHSTASAPCAGAGSICTGSIALGDQIEPADTGQSGAGDHDRVEFTGVDLAEPGIRLPRSGTMFETESQCAQAAPRGAAQRCRPSSPPAAHRAPFRRGRPARRADLPAAGSRR